MMSTRALVSIVDDDESVRESLPDLLKEFGFASRTFSSAEEFLASDARNSSAEENVRDVKPISLSRSGSDSRTDSSSSTIDTSVRVLIMDTSVRT